MGEREVERTTQNQCIMKNNYRGSVKLSLSAVQKVKRKKLNPCQEKQSVKERGKEPHLKQRFVTAGAL